MTVVSVDFGVQLSCMVMFTTVCSLFAVIAIVDVASTTAADSVAAAAASDVHTSIHTTGSVTMYSPAVTATSGQCTAAVSTGSSDQLAAGEREETGLIIDKKSSYFSILNKLCGELSLEPPTVLKSEKSTACTATLSVKYGFSSSKSHAKKVDAQEDAACAAVSGLKATDEKSAKNSRAQLNEYCQVQQSEKPEYVTYGSGPFSCTVSVQIVHKSVARPTESEAVNDAAFGILTKLGHVSHVLQMFSDPQFENFSVFCSARSVFMLTARYHFNRSTVGANSKTNAQKIAAMHALEVLYPDLNPKPPFDNCKNKLQELYTQEKPKYDAVPAEDGLYYSDVRVTFLEQMSSDNCSPLDAANDLAKRACKRLGLIP